MPAPHPVVQTRRLSFSYQAGDIREVNAVLKEINLQVAPGEYLVILGHNGSGKSTLAKQLNALLTPSEGQVLVCGMDTRDDSCRWEIRRQAGMVFQNPDNQIVGTTVEEDVAFGLENLGVAYEEMRQRVDESLKKLDIQHLAEREPHQLSGGQKQRLAIAGILAMRPTIIILDEATAMLDPSGRQEVMRAVRQLNRQEGICVIQITHFMEEALCADRVVVMQEGRIQMQGPPEEILLNREALLAAGLEVPFAVELAERLRRHGIPLDEKILHREQLVEALWTLLSKN
ncbi:MAG: energy-coupling factor transporter ATPase [Bacillus thermozeamaize]|mgnify:CR=1 FL=1|jgi:energy-coupling factor transport system ATP-binding protein|uniref:Energy-coupling factor transporter ATPase n=1 Tax=Bacillus thermozeamaize TaxID=230954 RepID=A0A1Y3PKS4_9BACI|nr:MAG: energy-coupling factor transporter ATPase [Bacillus thermozeamaize]